jgi:hypothetical protein
MNLSQLYQLRNNILQREAKVVEVNTFLSVLDSHIDAIRPKNDDLHYPLIKTSYNERQEAERMNTIRAKPTQEELMKAYGY